MYSMLYLEHIPLFLLSFDPQPPTVDLQMLTGASQQVDS